MAVIEAGSVTVEQGVVFGRGGDRDLLCDIYRPSPDVASKHTVIVHLPGGGFRGYEIPAGAYTYDVAFMYRFEHGRIAERWAVRDDLSMIQQLNGRPSRT